MDRNARQQIGTSLVREADDVNRPQIYTKRSGHAAASDALLGGWGWRRRGRGGRDGCHGVSTLHPLGNGRSGDKADGDLSYHTSVISGEVPLQHGLQGSLAEFVRAAEDPCIAHVAGAIDLDIEQ